MSAKSGFFRRRIGRGPAPQPLRGPHIALVRDPNPIRELVRTESLEDWLRELRTRELLEVSDALVAEQLRRGIRLDAHESALRRAAVDVVATVEVHNAQLGELARSALDRLAQALYPKLGRG